MLDALTANNSGRLCCGESFLSGCQWIIGRCASCSTSMQLSPCSPNTIPCRFTQARTLPLGIWAQGNLCDADDPDWFRVEIVKASDYSVTAPSIFGGAAVRITVYAEDGETVLANGQAGGVGQVAIVRFQAAVAGSFYIKIEPLTTYLMGTDAVYGVSAGEFQEVFLPLVAR